MPHILILDEILALLNQMNVYSHAIGEKIDNGDYHGQQLTNAQNLQSATSSLVGSINSSFRTSIEAKIADQEGLLGI